MVTVELLVEPLGEGEVSLLIRALQREEGHALQVYYETADGSLEEKVAHARLKLIRKYIYAVHSSTN